MKDLLTEKIYITEDSKDLILTNYKIYSRIAILFFITSAISFIIHTIRYLKNADQVYKNWFNSFNLKFYPIIAIMQIILSFFQVFYIFNGMKFQQCAVAESDQLLLIRALHFSPKDIE